jgi:hypothetical protein
LGSTVDYVSAMSFFGYRRELSKYEDVDEDELLASLSPEELAELEDRHDKDYLTGQLGDTLRMRVQIVLH